MARLYTFTVLLVLAFMASPNFADTPTPRPNIVFIFTDDHASHAISAYGSKVNKTPNIDRLAAEGMRFDTCLVTNSICGPSRACILTGKYSHKHGFYRNENRFDGSQQNFAKILQKTGYQTALIGKWHLESLPTGFDHYEILVGQGPYYNPPMIRNGDRVQHSGYTTDITGDLGLEWLQKQRDPNKPFVLMWQHKAPHREWQPHPRHYKLYDDADLPEPATLFDDYAGRGTAAHKQDMTIEKTLSPLDLKLRPPGNLNAEQLAAWKAYFDPIREKFEADKLTGKDLVRWKYQRYIKDYLRCIAAVDENIGRMLKYLDESGLAKNTIVIYSSDQGFYLGDHGWFDKRWMYEESLKMPLIVRWPGVVKAGSVNKDMVSNVDFAETFLDVAGADIPKEMQGRSFAPILKGKTPEDWRKSFYYHYYEFPGPHSVAKHYGVRTQTHKLIYYYTLNEWELFDLVKDPDELKSVYGDPAYAQLTEELKKELARLQQELGDTEPHKPVPGDPGTGKQKEKEKPKKNKQPAGGKPEQVFATPAGQAVSLDGQSTLKVADSRPDLSESAFTVGGWIKPAGEDGVIIAQGGASFGFSLYLKAGVAHFAIRNHDTLTQVTAKDALKPGEWTHVAGVLDDAQTLSLRIAGKEVAGAKGEAIANLPADALSVGADTGSIVGEYGEQNHFKGELRDVRYLLGVLAEQEMAAWAK